MYILDQNTKKVWKETAQEIKTVISWYLNL